MPLASEVRNSDYIPIVQDGENKRVSASLLGGTLYTAGSGILIDPTTNTISTNLHLCRIVQELPNTGEQDKIYLIKNNSADTGNMYEEYLYVDGSWELVGSLNTGVDLSEYSTITYVNDTADTICFTIGASLGNNVTDGADTGSVQTILQKHRTNSVQNSDFNTTIGTTAGQEVSFNSTHYVSNGNIKNAIEALDAQVYLKANTSDIPTKVSDLTNDSDFITSSAVNKLIVYDLCNENNYTISGKTLTLANSGSNGYVSFYVDSGENPYLIHGQVIGLGSAAFTESSDYATATDLNTKQDSLISGQTIKTVNGESILGSGNITISGGSDSENDIVKKVSIYAESGEDGGGMEEIASITPVDNILKIYNSGDKLSGQTLMPGITVESVTDGVRLYSPLAVHRSKYYQSMGNYPGEKFYIGETNDLNIQGCLTALNTKIGDIDTGVNSISLGSTDLGEDVKLLDSILYKFDAGMDSLAELSEGDVYFGSVGVFDDADGSNHKHLIGKVVGLGSAAYTDSSVYAPNIHTHTDSDVTTSGQSTSVTSIKDTFSGSLSELTDLVLSQDLFLRDSIKSIDANLYKIVTELPTTGEENKIYLIESNESGEYNVYTEYGYINGSWEKFGQHKSQVDLTNYALKSELPTLTSQLTNDSDFVTSAYVAEQIANAISTTLNTEV